MPELLFLAKKIVSACLMPLPVGAIIILFALFLSWRAYHKTAKTLFGIAFIFIYLISAGPVAVLMTEALEHQYPKYDNQTVSYVLVLGGSHDSDPRRPISSLLSTESLARLVEGIRIYRLNKGAKLLLSGYNAGDPISNAEAMSRVALDQGVPIEDIVLARSVKDTAEEARHWAAFAKGESMALVTSAMHMPRSVFLFEQYDVQLFPSPTAYTTGSRGLSWKSWFPRANSLKLVERAWHEYLGLAWAKLRR